MKVSLDMTEDDWEIECESPLEIRHKETGSFATGLAAEIILYIIKGEQDG